MPAETVKQVLDRLLARGRRLQLRGPQEPDTEDEADTSGSPVGLDTTPPQNEALRPS